MLPERFGRYEVLAAWDPKVSRVVAVPVVEGELVALDDDVTPPVRIRGGAAAYPAAARRDRRPHRARGRRVRGPVLDKAVLDAVRGWRFEPATKGA